MFYLNYFFTHIRRYPFSCLSFLFLGTFMVFLSLQNKALNDSIYSLFEERQRSSYFYALISLQKDQKKLKSKFINLPGVKAVQVLDSTQVQKKTNLLLKDYPLDLDPSLFKFNYFGFKIIFEPKAKERAHKLIKEYLIKLVGPENIIIGATQAPPPLKRPEGVLKWIQKTGGHFILGIVFFMWFFSGIGLLKSIRKVAYLIEKFQRRSYATLKIYTVGILIIISLGTTLSSLYGEMRWKDLSIMLIFLGVSFGMIGKKYQWNE